ncbi:hypothetical protein ABT160_16670 [Streptomyces sp. NPDC001941]
MYPTPIDARPEADRLNELIRALVAQQAAWSDKDRALYEWLRERWVQAA